MQLQLKLDQSQNAAKKARETDLMLSHIEQLNRQVEQLEYQLRQEQTYRQAQLSLPRQAEAVLRHFAGIVGDLYWETDAYFRLTHLTSCRGDRNYRLLNKFIGRLPTQMGFKAENAVWSAFETALSNFHSFRNFEAEVPLGAGVFACFAINGQPIYASNGDFLGYRGICTDITDRVRVERKLRDRDGAMRQAQNLAKIAYGIYDFSTKSVIEGQEELSYLLQISPKDLFATNPYFQRVVHPDDMQVFSSRYRSALAKGQTYKRDYRLIRSDGTVCSVSEAGAIERDATGRPVRLIFSLQDVSGQKKIEADLILARKEAEMASTAKSGFLAHMSHELRTPLNAIIGFSELMQYETFGPVGNDKYKEYISHIQNSGHHLLELINDVLDLSKVESGRAELKERHVRLYQLVNSALETVRVRAETKSIQLEQKIAPEISLYVDPIKLKQILINLLGNAVKFTPVEGFVRVEAFLNDAGHLSVQVQDSGCGISAEDLPKVLEPFRQVDLAQSHNQQEGTGLGLPLAKSLAALHQGDLVVESDLGIGTTITLILPSERVQLKAYGGETL